MRVDCEPVLVCEHGRASHVSCLLGDGIEERYTACSLPSSLIIYGRQESWPWGHEWQKWLCPSLVAALGRAGPTLHLGSTLEMVLVSGVAGETPEGLRAGDQWADQLRYFSRQDPGL